MRKTPKLLSALVILGLAAPALADGEVTTTTTATTTTAVSTDAAAPVVVVDTPYVTNRGWDGYWGLNFSLNNILTVGSILSSPIEGTFGGTYYLNHRHAIRAGIGFSRESNPATVSKVVTTNGGTSVATYTVTNPQGTTESDAFSLSGTYLWRFLESPLSPYAGVGGSVGWTLGKMRYTDDKSVVDQKTEFDNNSSGFNVTTHGVVGAEWRFNSNFAIFAEYQASLQIYRNTRVSNRTTIADTVAGTTSTTQTVTTQTYDSWLNLSTGLAQGASLGLTVFF